MKTRRKIVLSGGTGFLGRTLAAYFRSLGDDVVVLSRNPQENSSRAGFGSGELKFVAWDGKSRGDWCSSLDGADALINLAGRSVNCRYHEQNRRLMMDSRVESTRVLGEAIARCGAPPKVWLNSSTATIYAHTYGEAHGENSQDFQPSAAVKDHWSVQVASAWEKAFEQAYEEYGLDWTRPVVLRTSLVFGFQPGGVWHTLRKLVRLGLGGKMASGKQWVSWIHSQDFCRAIDWLIDSKEESRTGAYNLAAPHPVSNKQMMTSLRQELNRPWGLSASKWMLELGAWMMQTETELILKSRRIIPQRLQHEGFEFLFPSFTQAIADLETAGLDEARIAKQKCDREQGAGKIGKLRLGS